MKEGKEREGERTFARKKVKRDRERKR